MSQQPFSTYSFDSNEFRWCYDPQPESLGKGNQANISGFVTLGDMYSFCSKRLEPVQQLPTFSGCSVLNNDFLSAEPLSEILERENGSIFGIDSIYLLRNYGRGFTKTNGEKDQHRRDEKDGPEKLSAEDIMRIAGKRYIDCTTRIDETIMSGHPFFSSLRGFSVEEERSLDLAQLLLIAAEKVGRHQHDQASKLLTGCDWLASDTGNPVQRVAYYFTKALRERIRREKGRIRSETGLHGMAMSTNLVFLKFHQVFPFNQVTMFAGIDAILKRVEKATNIHLIDLQIRSGVQWTVFIQALTERVSYPIQHLKITAIGTTDRQKMQETGKSLESFAESLNLPFSYKIIFLSDTNNLRKEHFTIKQHEEVVVYCPLILRTMIGRPDCLENLMRVIMKLNPSMAVIIEVEANHNSPSFFHRFIEALFFYSAYFDCLDECADRDNDYRNILEKVYFGDGIENIVAAEGKDRTTRSMKMSAWETFFKRFGMEQMELGESSINQANLNLKQFACAGSCNLDYKGKTLTVGWKGTPIQSLSTWKFY